MPKKAVKVGHGREAGKMSEEGVPASPEEIEAKISQLKDKRGSLREERAMLVESVRGMRASASESREKSTSRRKHLNQFHESKKIADTAKKERDEINRAVPPPVSVLEDWSSKSLKKLQGVDNDLTTMPTLSREIREFSRYFELNAAIEIKKKGEIAHTEYVRNIRKMKEVMDTLEAEHPRKEVDEKGGPVIKTEMKEIRKVSKRIEKLDKEIDKIGTDVKDLIKKSREIKDQIKINNAKDRVMSGTTIAADDIALLLEKGGDLGDLTGIAPGNKSKSSRSNQSKQKSRKIGVARGGPRKTRLRSER